jgi:SagB-type dehydrogenase family enzyme
LPPTDPYPYFGGVVRRWSPAQCRAAIDLPPGREPPSTAFSDLLDQRRSRRAMRSPSLARIGELLWHAARSRETGTGRFGIPWEHRASASAGGLHAVQVFAVLPCAPGLHLYDAIRHQLLEVSTTQEFVAALVAKAREILPEADGAVLVFAGDRSLAASAYANPESLVWRDAGCLLATFHMCAEWLGFAFCPLGVLGEELVASIDGNNALIAAGACVFGELEP